MLHYGRVAWAGNLHVRRPEAMEHGLGCFARLVRILLGAGAVAERKMEFGPWLCILGIDLLLSNAGFQCLPSADKAKRWTEILLEAVAELHLPPGLSSKVAGKLSWGCTQLFHRIGRAMLRPFFDQRTSCQQVTVAPVANNGCTSFTWDTAANKSRLHSLQTSSHRQ